MGVEGRSRPPSRDHRGRPRREGRSASCHRRWRPGATARPRPGRPSRCATRLVIEVGVVDVAGVVRRGSRAGRDRGCTAVESRPSASRTAAGVRCRRSARSRSHRSARRTARGRGSYHRRSASRAPWASGHRSWAIGHAGHPATCARCVRPARRWTASRSTLRPRGAFEGYRPRPIERLRSMRRLSW